MLVTTGHYLLELCWSFAGGGYGGGGKGNEKGDFMHISGSFHFRGLMSGRLMSRVVRYDMTVYVLAEADNVRSLPTVPRKTLG